MSIITKIIFKSNGQNTLTRSTKTLSNLSLKQFSSRDESQDYKHEEGEFRVLSLRTLKSQQQRRVRKKSNEYAKLEPRSDQMAIDQDWGSVWTGPRSFHPASVPLPLRQGYAKKNASPPDKYANTELMKIPNFLHLTPPVIKKQCEALKKFCTKWPQGLETETKWKKYFPIDLITSDYCHGLPTIRSPLARIVTIQFKLSTLPLDKHAKDKFLRLAGPRYNAETDVITIVTDRCPLRKQNYDYAQYLLTALFHESWITEPWEVTTKSIADMEYYDWHLNKSKESVVNIINWNNKDDGTASSKSSTSDLNDRINEFAKSVENMINEGENEYNIDKYKIQVMKLLNLPERNTHTV